MVTQCHAAPSQLIHCSITERESSYKKIYSIESDLCGLLHWAQMLLGSKSPIQFVFLLLDAKIEVIHSLRHLEKLHDECGCDFTLTSWFESFSTFTNSPALNLSQV